MKKVIVIGGGFSGLATAALLAKKGYTVTLLEKNKTLGGRARSFSKGGFMFDMGPSWYMMPEVFEKYFGLFNKKPSDYYKLVKLDPHYQVFFEDGSHKKINKTSLNKTSPLGLNKYLNRVQQSYNIALELIYKNPHDATTWLNFRFLVNALRFFFIMPFFIPWYTYVSRFVDNEKLKKILTFPAVFLGGSPFNTPTLYAILSWADIGRGIWYPMGGFRAVVKSLEKLAQEHGVTILNNHTVKSCRISQNKITSITCGNGKKFNADIIIAACDLHHFETKLLPLRNRTYSATYWKKTTKGISAVLLYIGLTKKLQKNRMHHTIFFAPRWREHFDAIFTSNTLVENPSFYVSATSVTDPAVSPVGTDQLFVLIPTPSHLAISDQAYRQHALAQIPQLENIFGPLKKNIAFMQTYTPHDFAIDYNAYDGTALGIAHTLRQSLFLRPGLKSKKISNLYYTGQYTQPGVGVPMCIISAELVTKEIEKDEKKRKNIQKR